MIGSELSNNAEIPVVTVVMTTYNHEKFIAQAIESIIFQKTNFSFRLFVGEDCSKDNTRKICREYADKYPEKMTLICTEKNNIVQNSLNVLYGCINSGCKYMANCEGDDYWTDPYKLQKQVDFLENNPDFSTCFAGVDILDEMGWNMNPEFYVPTLTKDVYTIEDYILSPMNIIPSPTIMTRNIYPYPLPDFYINGMSGDMALQLMAADKGKLKYMDEKMAVYRNHSGGVTKSAKNIEKGEMALMKLYEEADKYFNGKYHSVMMKRLKEIAKYRLMRGSREKKGLHKIKHYFKYIPEYFKYSEKLNVKELLYYNTLYFLPGLLKYKK